MSSVFLILFVSVLSTVHSAPAPREQVFRSLFGSHLSSLVLAPPPPPPRGDITEGSGAGSAPSAHAVIPLAVGQDVNPRVLLDLVRGRGKMWRRSRKSSVGGGRGCFGMKMDRIGSISGLGC